MPYPNWTGDCPYIKDLHCPHYYAMLSSAWMCMRDCDRLESRREIKDNMIIILDCEKEGLKP